MKPIVMLLAAAAFTVTAGQASADVTFNLSNATFYSQSSGGTAQGTLTGSFTTNNSLSSIVGYSLTASTGDAAPGQLFAFPGFTYTPLNSSVTASSLPSQFFQIDGPSSLFELRLYFANPLTSSGASLSQTFSYENEFLAGNRFLSGSVVNAAAITPTTGAVPEPASWAMMIFGVGAIGFAMRRRNVATKVKFA